jgi:hypothetical protein
MESEAPVLAPELRAAMEAARAERLGRFGWEHVAWLCLLPEWSDELARACGFPARDEGLERFVERAAAAGLCERREEIGRGGRAELRFWVPTLQREELLDAVKDELGRSTVRRLAGEVAERLLELGDRVAPSLRHWAELAAPETSAYAGAARLGEEVRRSADQVSALDWIAAGEGLAPVLGGDLGAAVSRGKRRVNLEYRRRADERMLARYVPREGAEAALRRLVEGDDDEWALHLIGMGGVGKTMLVRYLVGRLAPEHDLAVGRVDFDHIDPRFPWERPAELLVELADALAVHVATPEQERALENFVEDVRRSDEARTQPTGAGLALLETPAFTSAVASFVRFLSELRRPVVLVLDTCEELAKLHPAEGTVRSVDALFAILEALQRDPSGPYPPPRVRVLLAGRRLLATAGAGWSYDSATRQPAALTSLEERPYLRLHEVRGFDRDEAAALLGRIDDELLAAILDASRETGRVPGVPGGSEGTGRDRYNPFDLELYAQWIEEAPGLRAADVAAGGTDAYVKARIVDRLREQGVDALLPAAVLLRRFDLAMLEPVMPADADERGRLMEALAEQEWVDLAAGETPDTMIVAVEPHLLPRLERWFEGGARRSELAAGRARLGPHVARLLLEAPLDALAVDRADAALRLLDGSERERAWLDLEQRIAREGSWEWAAGTCERLLGADEATGMPQHRELRAAIEATRVAALLHRSGRVGPESWEDVIVDIERMPPDSALVEPLRRRALLGLMATGRAVPMMPGWPADVSGLIELVLIAGADRRPVDQSIASGIAALEAVADGSGSGVRAARPFPVAQLWSWAAFVEEEADDRELAAAAWLVTARLLGGAGHVDEASAAFETAERVASDCAAGTHQRWLDWLAPDSMLDRVRLEWLLSGLAGPTLEGAEERAREWLSGAQERIDRIDGERLASLWLLDVLGRRLPPLPLVAELSGPAGDLPELQPRCAAHERVPPLFVSVARAWTAHADADEACALLEQRIFSGEARRGADVALARTVALARVELLAVLRRLRGATPELPGPEGRWMYLAGRALNEPGTTEELAEALALAALVTGAKPPPLVAPVSATELHARWRASAGADPALVRLLAAGRRADSSAPAVLRMHLALDGLEAARLGFERLGDAADDVLDELHDADPGAAGDAEWIRLVLRCRALYVGEPRLERAPPRRVAELALEEGELLALRMPSNACRLLDEAHRLFVAAGDPVGGFFAAVARVATEQRSGHEGRARELVAGEAMQAYERLRDAGYGRLPPWEALVAGKELELGGSPLAPWVGRLAPYAHWAEGGGNPPLWSGRVAPPPAEDVARRPEPVAAAPPPPPETHGVVVGAHMTMPNRRPAPVPEPRSRWRRRLAALAAGLIVLAVTVAVAGSLMQSGAPTVSPGDTADGLPLALWAIVLAVVVLALGGLWALRRRGRTPFAYRCSITRTRPGHARVELTVDPRLPLEGPRPRHRETRAQEVALPEAGAAQGARGLLELLAAGRIPERARVALTVEPALAPAPWESTLTGRGVAPAIWRVPTIAHPARAPARGLTGGVAALAPERWLLLVEEAWAPLEVDAVGGTPWMDGARKRRIVHLVGAPAQTSGGWRLRIKAGTLESPASGTVTAASVEQQELLDPHSVSRGAELLVVQGVPGVLDAEGAAGLRGVAAAAQAAGAYAVLTIPSLPPDVAALAIAALASGLPKRPSRLGDLLDLSRRVRAEIARTLPASELVALDAALFAPPEKE